MTTPGLVHPSRRFVQIRPKPGPALARFDRCAIVSLGLLLGGILLTESAADHWPSGLCQAGVFLLGFATIQRAFWQRKALKGSRLLVLSAIIPIWGLMQLALGATAYRFATGESIVIWSTLVCLTFLGGMWCQDAEGRRLLANCLLTLGGAMAVFKAAQLFGPPVAVVPQLSSNTYAELCELLLPLALTRALLERPRWLAYAGYCAALYATVIASGERMGAILATLEIVAIFAIVRLQNRLASARWNRVVGSLALLALVAILVEGAGTLSERLSEKDPLHGRRDILASTLAMVRQRPLAGHGLGTFPEIYPAYARFDNGYSVNHAHNDWLEIASDGGIVCLLPVILIAATLMRPAVTSVWGIGLPALFAHSFFDYPLHRLSIAACLFLVAAALPSRRLVQMPRSVLIG